jgi:hypothetical protein
MPFKTAIGNPTANHGFWCGKRVSEIGKLSGWLIEKENVSRGWIKPPTFFIS